MQFKMKQAALSIVVAAGLFTGSVAPTFASGIPTFDGAAAANAIKSFSQMKEQIDNQIKQLQQLKGQVKAMTGSRNIGSLVSNTVQSQVPDEWKSIYDSVKNTDYKSVINGKKYDAETSLKLLATNEVLSEKAFDELKNQLNRIEQLQNQINSTQDIKAAADLQNAISTEQARINNTQIKLDMMERLYQQQEKIEKKKYASREACMARHMYDRNYSECQQ